jgi:hypothetical protein
MNAIVIDNTIIPTKEDDIRNLDTYTLVCYKYMLSIEYLYRLIYIINKDKNTKHMGYIWLHQQII